MGMVCAYKAPGGSFSRTPVKPVIIVLMFPSKAHTPQLRGGVACALKQHKGRDQGDKQSTGAMRPAIVSGDTADHRDTFRELLR